MKRCKRLASLVLLGISPCLSMAWPQVPGVQPLTPAQDDPGVILAERWIGRALILRDFPDGDALRYTADGHLLTREKAVDWTLAGFELQKVSRRPDGDLQLDGLRVAIRYNPDQHIFERHPQKQDSLHIVFPAPAAERVEAALAAIFSVGIDPALQRSMPLYWSHYFIPALAWPQDSLTGSPVVPLGAKAADGAVYPVLTRKSEPGFTAQSSAEHIKGTVRITLVVDSEGMPQRIVVRQPLGYGLDQKTVGAVEKYRFQPGRIQEKPAAFEFVVNQAFE